MGRKKSFITVTDQFCGAGGSSQGVRRLAERKNGGLEVTLAMNHWKLAIETHNTNFPDTHHDCTDISACDPRRYPSTDILITSPECTTHSPAGGNRHKVVKNQMDLFDKGTIDAATERSRATMWDVCRFTEYHKYNAIIVENVVEAKTRWPLFDVWLTAMFTLGYNHKCVYLNSMHCHPTPQSRDRMYIVFWKKGNRAPMLDYTPVAHCPDCGKNVNAIQTWKQSDKRFGKYKQQYVYCCPVHGKKVEPYYYAAFNCIDWSDIGIRIGDRKKPLSENTVTRIKYGLNKYGSEPFQVQTVNGGEHVHRTRALLEPSFTHTTLQSQGFIIDDKHTTGIDYRVNPISGRLPTLTTDHRLKLITPFVIQNENASQKGYVRSVGEALQTQNTRQSMSVVTPQIVANYSPGYTKPANEPLPSITCADHNALLTPPFITEYYGTGKAKPITDPAISVTAQGNKHGLVTTETWNSFIAQYYGGSNCTTDITEAVGCVTTNDRSGLVSYQQPNIEDCYYRMLKPPEIKLAMAFDKDYIILGNGKDQVKQCGNAVTPPAMEWLIEQVVASLN